MAVLKGPFYSLRAQGRWADLFGYYRKDGKNIAHVKKPPTKRKTAKQEEIRLKFLTASGKIWSVKLTGEDIIAWRRYQQYIKQYHSPWRAFLMGTFIDNAKHVDWDVVSAVTPFDITPSSFKVSCLFRKPLIPLMLRWSHGMNIHGTPVPMVQTGPITYECFVSVTQTSRFVYFNIWQNYGLDKEFKGTGLYYIKLPPLP